MELQTARIPTRSRRQAMDWSLVLISQGIESTIQLAEDNQHWELVIAQGDHERALQSLRLYQKENRPRPWLQPLFQPGLLFDWTSLACALLFCVFYGITALREDFRGAGIMDSVAVSHGQWWRLFTAVWLHADLAHLANNALFGFVLLGLAMGSYGTGTGLLIAYLTGAGGNLVVWLFAPTPHYSLGASGMIMGSLGLLAIQSLSLWRIHPRAAKYLLSGVAGGLMLFILLGVSPGSDVLAHLGGFISGLVLGSLAILNPKWTQNRWAKTLSGFLFAWLVLWPWWLALRHFT